MGEGALVSIGGSYIGVDRVAFRNIVFRVLEGLGGAELFLGHCDCWYC